MISHVVVALLIGCCAGLRNLSHSTHTFLCSQSQMVHQFTNLSTSDTFMNLKLFVSSRNQNVIMKVYPRIFGNYHDYTFPNQTSSDGGLVDFSSLFLHSDKQIVSFESQAYVYAVVYRYKEQNFQYTTLDYTFPQPCQTISYDIILTSSNEKQTPPCLHGGSPNNGICQCSGFYTMRNCQVEYQYVNEVGTNSRIDPGMTQYYYFKSLQDTNQTQVSVRFQSDSDFSHVLIALQEGEFPSTIPCIFNQLNPENKQIVVRKNHVLMVAIHQPEGAASTTYWIWIEIQADSELILILLFSLGGFFSLIIVGVCAFYWVNKTQNKKKNLVANIIVSYDSIFPTISYEIFVKVIGEPDHQNCVICLEDFSSTSEVKYTICGHILHSNCLESWLARDQNCPLCRQDFSDENLVLWQQKLNIDFEEEFRKFKRKSQKHKKKKNKRKNQQYQNQTLSSIKRGKKQSQMESNIANRSQNFNVNYMEEYAISLYKIVYAFHKKSRNPNEILPIEENVQNLVFEIPSKDQIQSSIISPKKETHRFSQGQHTITQHENPYYSQRQID